MAINLQGFISPIASRIRGLIPDEEQIKKIKEQFKEKAISLASFVKEKVSPKKEFLSPLSEPTPTPTESPVKKGIRELNERRNQPSPTPTATPTAIPTLAPKTTPIPSATPTPIPSHIKEIAYEERPYHKEIKETWGDDSNIAHDILRYVDEQGVVRGENVEYKAGREIDIANRIDPKTGKWDNDAPITQITNQFTKEQEDSIDRGLFRINNATFYLYLGGAEKGYRDAMYKAGIIDDPHSKWKDLTSKKVQEYWDRMLDPIMNTKMAKIIYDKQKKAWFAAKPTTGARL